MSYFSNNSHLLLLFLSLSLSLSKLDTYPHIRKAAHSHNCKQKLGFPKIRKCTAKKAYSIAVVDTTSSSAKIRTLTVAQRVRIQRTTPNIILSNVNSDDEVSLRPKVKIPTAAQTEIQLTNRFHSDRSCGRGFKSFQVAFFQSFGNER